MNTLKFKASRFHCNERKPVLTVFIPAVGMLGPRNLRVSDEWYTRFRVSWDPAPSRVNGYKLIYQPEGMVVSSMWKMTIITLCIHFLLRYIKM